MMRKRPHAARLAGVAGAVFPFLQVVFIAGVWLAPRIAARRHSGPEFPR
jgi:hypothetical protein